MLEKRKIQRNSNEMIVTETEVQTALRDVDSTAVHVEMLEVFDDCGSKDFFNELQQLETDLSRDLFEVLNSIAACKYDQMYGGVALDERGDAWFSGAMLALVTLDNVASRKAVDPKHYRDSMLRSGLLAVFCQDEESEASKITEALGFIDEVGSRDLGSNGYRDLAAAVALDALDEAAMREAFMNGYTFTFYTGRRAVAATWISNESTRGLELLLDQSE